MKDDPRYMLSLTVKERAVLFWVTRKKYLTTLDPNRTHGTVIFCDSVAEHLLYLLADYSRRHGGTRRRIANRLCKKIISCRAHPLERLALA